MAYRAHVPFHHRHLNGVLLLGLALSALRVHWSCPRSPTEATPRLPACTPTQPCLAIIIDDLGRRARPLRRLLKMPLDLTYGVLPHARGTASSLMALCAAQREYWLHLPLEPLGTSAITDERVILQRMGEIEVDTLNAWVFLPGAYGVSGHMGSAFTADKEAVTRLLRVLRLMRLPFLDSKTTQATVACATAHSEQVPCLERDVFLDDRDDPATVSYRLGVALAIAKRRGWAIAVGHPEERTIQALLQFSRTSAAMNVVRLSQIFKRRSLIWFKAKRPLTQKRAGP